MADIMNVVRENNDYDGLNENSTDAERLDVAFKILLKSHSPIWLDYRKLFVKNGKERAFDVKLKDTRLVDYNDSNGYNPTYKINDMGIKVFEAYSKFSDFANAVQEREKEKNEKQEVKENLEMQKLRGEVDALSKRLYDYDSTKKRAIRGDILSIIAVILTLIGLLLQWIMRKNG